MNIDKLTHKNAALKRLKFAAQSERFSAEQKRLLGETLDSDLAAVAAEIEAPQPSRATGERQQPRRRRPIPVHRPSPGVRQRTDARGARREARSAPACLVIAMNPKTHYATLGVAPTATQAQIKRAYRKLARRFHPDVSHEARAEEHFKNVAQAHEILIDPQQRAAYDAELAAPPPLREPTDPQARASHRPSYRAADEADLQRAFREFFARPSEPQPRSGDDWRAQVQVELADAYRGATRSLHLRVPVTGADGVPVEQDRHLEVHIPKGVRQGQQLRLRGQGTAGTAGAPAGDLYLEVAFVPHPPFTVDAADVYLDLAVTPWEAALGAVVRAPTPTGSVQLTIPAGSHARRRLRLKGLGLPGLPPGDLYAVLDIVQPAADSPGAQQAYRDLAGAFPNFQPRSASASACAADGG